MKVCNTCFVVADFIKGRRQCRKCYNAYHAKKYHLIKIKKQQIKNKSNVNKELLSLFKLSKKYFYST